MEVEVRVVVLLVEVVLCCAAGQRLQGCAGRDGWTVRSMGGRAVSSFQRTWGVCLVRLQFSVRGELILKFHFRGAGLRGGRGAEVRHRDGASQAPCATSNPSPRWPGAFLIGRGSHPSTYSVPDGAHVPWLQVQHAHRWKGKERGMMVRKYLGSGNLEPSMR
jgi:hypothetical protein